MYVPSIIHMYAVTMHVCIIGLNIIIISILRNLEGHCRCFVWTRIVNGVAWAFHSHHYAPESSKRNEGVLSIVAVHILSAVSSHFWETETIWGKSWKFQCKTVHAFSSLLPLLRFFLLICGFGMIKIDHPLKRLASRAPFHTVTPKCATSSRSEKNRFGIQTRRLFLLLCFTQDLQTMMTCFVGISTVHCIIFKGPDCIIQIG